MSHSGAAGAAGSPDSAASSPTGSVIYHSDKGVSWFVGSADLDDIAEGAEISIIGDSPETVSSLRLHRPLPWAESKQALTPKNIVPDQKGAQTRQMSERDVHEVLDRIKQLSDDHREQSLQRAASDQISPSINKSIIEVRKTPHPDLNGHSMSPSNSRSQPTTPSQSAPASANSSSTSPAPDPTRTVSPVPSGSSSSPSTASAAATKPVSSLVSQRMSMFVGSASSAQLAHGAGTDSSLSRSKVGSMTNLFAAAATSPPLPALPRSVSSKIGSAPAAKPTTTSSAPASSSVTSPVLPARTSALSPTMGSAPLPAPLPVSAAPAVVSPFGVQLRRTSAMPVMMSAPSAAPASSSLVSPSLSSPPPAAASHTSPAAVSGPSPAAAPIPKPFTPTPSSSAAATSTATAATLATPSSSSSSATSTVSASHSSAQPATSPAPASSSDSPPSTSSVLKRWPLAGQSNATSSSSSTSPPPAPAPATTAPKPVLPSPAPAAAASAAPKADLLPLASTHLTRAVSEGTAVVASRAISADISDHPTSVSARAAAFDRRQQMIRTRTQSNVHKNRKPVQSNQKTRTSAESAAAVKPRITELFQPNQAFFQVAQRHSRAYLESTNPGSPTSVRSLGGMPTTPKTPLTAHSAATMFTPVATRTGSNTQSAVGTPLSRVRSAGESPQRRPSTASGILSALGPTGTPLVVRSTSGNVATTPSGDPSTPSSVAQGSSSENLVRDRSATAFSAGAADAPMTPPFAARMASEELRSQVTPLTAGAHEISVPLTAEPTAQTVDRKSFTLRGGANTMRKYRHAARIKRALHKQLPSIFTGATWCDNEDETLLSTPASYAASVDLRGNDGLSLLTRKAAHSMFTPSVLSQSIDEKSAAFASPSPPPPVTITEEEPAPTPSHKPTSPARMAPPPVNATAIHTSPKSKSLLSAMLSQAKTASPRQAPSDPPAPAASAPVPTADIPSVPLPNEAEAVKLEEAATRNRAFAKVSRFTMYEPTESVLQRMEQLDASDDPSFDGPPSPSYDMPAEPAPMPPSLNFAMVHSGSEAALQRFPTPTMAPPPPPCPPAAAASKPPAPAPPAAPAPPVPGLQLPNQPQSNNPAARRTSKFGSKVDASRSSFFPFPGEEQKAPTDGRVNRRQLSMSEMLAMSPRSAQLAAAEMENESDDDSPDSPSIRSSSRNLVPTATQPPVLQQPKKPVSSKMGPSKRLSVDPNKTDGMLSLTDILNMSPSEAMRKSSAAAPPRRQSALPAPTPAESRELQIEKESVESLRRKSVSIANRTSPMPPAASDPDILRSPRSQSRTGADSPSDGEEDDAELSQFRASESHLPLCDHPLMVEAKSQDLSDVQHSGVCYYAGRSHLNRELLVIVGGRLPSDKGLLYRVLLYFCLLLEQYGQSEYEVIYSHTQSPLTRKFFSWLTEAHKSMPHIFRKNVMGVHIVETSFWVKVFFSYFNGSPKKFFNKLHFHEDISATSLLAMLTRPLLPYHILPPFVVLKFTKAARAKRLKRDKLSKGELLADIADADGLPYRGLPRVVFECIDYLRQYALDTEGLFRVPGNNNLVKTIMGLYTQEADVVLSSGDSGALRDHIIAGVLKLYIRQLPTPLIPFKLYDRCIKAVGPLVLEGRSKGTGDASKLEEAVVKVRDLISSKEVPPANRLVLRYLTRFLVDVDLHSKVNKMTASNLALVFAPNLIRAEHETPESMMRDASLAIKVIELLIAYHHQTFPQDKSFVY